MDNEQQTNPYLDDNEQQANPYLDEWFDYWIRVLWTQYNGEEFTDVVTPPTEEEVIADDWPADWRADYELHEEAYEETYYEILDALGRAKPFIVGKTEEAGNDGAA